MYYLRKTDISNVPGFSFYKVNNIKIKINNQNKVNWCIDGEKLEVDKDEVEIKVNSNVQIMIPKTNIDKLFIK